MHRQILGYLPANVIPALISVATIYVFTRLLPPAAFGLYTVGFNAVMFVQGAVFIALPLAVMRFLPADLRDGTQAALLSTAWADFALVCAPLAGAGLGLLLVLPMDPDIRAILLVALPALALRAVVAMSQAQARACNAVLRYGRSGGGGTGGGGGRPRHAAADARQRRHGQARPAARTPGLHPAARRLLCRHLPAAICRPVSAGHVRRRRGAGGVCGGVQPGGAAHHIAVSVDQHSALPDGSAGAGA